jgi:hypothetical protein
MAHQSDVVPDLSGAYRDVVTALAGIDEPIATQGHVLRAQDLLVTLIVEAGVHHLDLIGSLGRPGPSATTLAYVRRTLDGLLGHACPTSGTM